MAKVVKLKKKPIRRKPAKKRENETVTVLGQVKLADEFAEAKSKLDAAQKAMDEARAVLEPLAKQEQLAAEKGGAFTKRVRFQGTGKVLTFAFTNAFAPLDVGCKASVRAAVGPKFDELFETVEKVTVREGAVEKLRRAIEKAGLNPDDFFEVSRVVEPVDNFRKLRFDARKEMDDENNEALDELIEELAKRPSLSVR